MAKLPINRGNKFFSEAEFNLFQDISREYVEDVLNFTVVLFQVDREKTTFDEVYGETAKQSIVYLPPVELKVGDFTLEKSENKNYAGSNARYLEYGKLSFTIHTAQLEEKLSDIKYGDIIGYAPFENVFKYFTVVNDGKIFANNENTMFGYKGYFRNIECINIDENEFNG